MSVQLIRQKRVSNSVSSHEPRIAALEAKQHAMHSTLEDVNKRVTQATTDLADVKNDTTTIREVLVHTKSIGGFVAKHGPRVIAFGLGGLVLSGKMPTEWAALLKVLFGI